MSSTYTFRTPQIPACSLRAKEICFAGSGFEANLENVFTPRSVLDLLSLLDSGESEDFHLIEWVKLFNDLEGWAECAPLLTKNLVTSFLVQSMAQDAVRFMALSRLSEYIGGASGGIPEVVFDCLDSAKGLSEGRSKEGLELLIALREKSYQNILQRCYKSGKSPRKFFELNCIFYNWENEYKLALELGGFASERVTNFNYMKSFFDLMAEQSRVQVVEGYLLKNTKFKFETVELKWLDNKVKPCRGPYWFLISDSAKQVLLKLYGSLGLNKLNILLEKISSENRHGNKENSNVISRVKFWTNYSDSIKRFRLVMSQADLETYADIMDGVDVTSYAEPSSNPMVLLLDLGFAVVAQYLGGYYAEIRFFKNRDKFQDIFFDKNISNSEFFRSYKFDGYCDHAFGWQNYAVKLLRERFDIAFNEDLKFFYSLPRPAGEIYGKELNRPDNKYFSDRSQYIDSWVDKFWGREKKNYPGENINLKQEKYNLSNLIISDLEFLNRKISSEPDIVFDPQAIVLLREAAENGDSSAQFKLGLKYDSGQGVRQDDLLAIYWYTKAAEQGHDAAQYNLGVMYANGQGVKRDLQKAISCYRIAANNGYASAQVNLGVMYASGEGLNKNLVVSYALLSLAKSSGNKNAAESRIFVSSKMTPIEINDAESLVLIMGDHPIQAIDHYLQKNK